MAMYALANDMGPEFALHCLLHDAAEGYVGDMIRAMKVAVPEFKIVEGAVEQAVFTRYKLHPTAIEFGAVKTLDQRIVPLEKQFLFGEKGLDWAFDQVAPLDGVTIQGWMPVQAKLNYIVLHNRLCHLSGRDYLTEPGDFK
jgi:hypothetical protein